jgi:hypothetical protein
MAQDDEIIIEGDHTNRLGEQVVKNYKKEKDKTPDHLYCFAAAHARVKKATQQVCGVPLKELTEPPGPFARLWGSLMGNNMEDRLEWLALPEEYRGKGAAGAMVWDGRGELVESGDIWAGKLKPGAVIQVWRDGRDPDRVKEGRVPESIGHSFIFLKYTKVGSGITGMKVADQGFFRVGQTVRRGDWGYWVGANIFCD